MKELADGVDAIVRAARLRGSSDFTMAFAETGLTLHANAKPRPEAEPRLLAHMTLRKYTQRATQWFGLCLDPGTGSIRFGEKIAFPWKHDSKIARMAGQLGKSAAPSPMPLRRDAKIGRNTLCPCGSGKKYKKCHGR